MSHIFLFTPKSQPAALKPPRGGLVGRNGASDRLESSELPAGPQPTVGGRAITQRSVEKVRQATAKAPQLCGSTKRDSVNNFGRCRLAREMEFSWSRTSGQPLPDPPTHDNSPVRAVEAGPGGEARGRGCAPTSTPTRVVGRGRTHSPSPPARCTWSLLSSGGETTAPSSPASPRPPSLPPPPVVCAPCSSSPIPSHPCRPVLHIPPTLPQTPSTVTHRPDQRPLICCEVIPPSPLSSVCLVLVAPPPAPSALRFSWVPPFLPSWVLVAAWSVTQVR